MRLLALVKSINLFLCKVGLVDRNLRGTTNSELHGVLTVVAGGHFLNTLANVFVATLIRDSSTAAIVVMDFIGTKLLSLKRSVTIVVKTGIKAAIAT